MAARNEILDIHMAASVEEYIVQLINATRRPNIYSLELGEMLEYGASPRGTIALDRCARAFAWLQGKDFVSPDDVQAVIHDCLRHRLILSSVSIRAISRRATLICDGFSRGAIAD